MKRLLLVDDDAVVTRAYRDRLSAHGFQVATAASAAGALAFLASAKPDLVVLDLMMPEVSGVEVLKFVRAQRRLAATPVVVLANEVQDDLGRHAARLGIQKAFRKDQCSPTVLMAAIDEILEPRAPAVPSEPVTAPGTPPDAPLPEATVPAGRDHMAQDRTEASTGAVRVSFLADAPATCADLGELSAALSGESLTRPQLKDHLQDLFLKVRFLAEAADLARFAALAQAAAAFDSLLNVLMENPQGIGPSAQRTVQGLVEVVELLFEEARESGGGTPLSARVLVVDDDPVTNETVVAALDRAQLNALSTEDSLAAWQWINSEHFDLVLLRIEMPVLNGLQLCECLRRVPGYEKTPVVLMGTHDDPDTRATSALIGADDLIAKAMLPQEIAARVLMRLVRTKMQPGLGSVRQIHDRAPESQRLAHDRSQTNNLQHNTV
jgi:DNA-binding response OmpR family regulator